VKLAIDVRVTHGESALFLAVVPTLFDTGSKCYRFHGHDHTGRVDPTETNVAGRSTQALADGAWVEAVGVGAQVEVQPGYNEDWVCAHVLGVSPTNTEMQVRLTSNGAEVWIEKDIDSVRRCGSAASMAWDYEDPMDDEDDDKENNAAAETALEAAAASSLESGGVFSARGLVPGALCDAASFDPNTGVKNWCLAKVVEDPRVLHAFIEGAFASGGSVMGGEGEDGVGRWGSTDSTGSPSEGGGGVVGMEVVGGVGDAGDGDDCHHGGNAAPLLHREFDREFDGIMRREFPRRLTFFAPPVAVGSKVAPPDQYLDQADWGAMGGNAGGGGGGAAEAPDEGRGTPSEFGGREYAVLLVDEDQVLLHFVCGDIDQKAGGEEVIVSGLENRSLQIHGDDENDTDWVAEACGLICAGDVLVCIKDANGNDTRRETEGCGYEEWIEVFKRKCGPGRTDACIPDYPLELTFRVGSSKVNVAGAAGEGGGDGEGDMLGPFKSHSGTNEITGCMFFDDSTDHLHPGPLHSTDDEGKGAQDEGEGEGGVPGVGGASVAAGEGGTSSATGAPDDLPGVPGASTTTACAPAISALWRGKNSPYGYTSELLLEQINWFGDEGGFDLLLSTLDGLCSTCAAGEGGDKWGDGGEGGKGGYAKALGTLQAMVTAVAMISPHLHRQLLYRLVLHMSRCVLRFLGAVETTQELRGLSRSTLDALLGRTTGLGKMGERIFGAPVMAQVAECARLEVRHMHFVGKAGGGREDKTWIDTKVWFHRRVPLRFITDISLSRHFRAICLPLSRIAFLVTCIQVARKWLQAPVLGCRLNAISFICELATRAQQDAASVAAAVKAGGLGLDPGLLSPLLLRTSSSNVQEVERKMSAVSSFNMDSAASATVVMAWPALDDVAAIVKAWDLVPGIFDPPTGHRALVERAEPVLSCLGRRDGLADTELLGTFFALRIQRVHKRVCTMILMCSLCLP
jgi:hypothetical protein